GARDAQPVPASGPGLARAAAPPRAAACAAASPGRARGAAAQPGPELGLRAQRHISALQHAAGCAARIRPPRVRGERAALAVALRGPPLEAAPRFDAPGARG